MGKFTFVHWRPGQVVNIIKSRETWTHPTRANKINDGPILTTLELESQNFLRQWLHRHWQMISFIGSKKEELSPFLSLFLNSSVPLF